MTAIATHKLMNDVLVKHGFEGAIGLIIGSDAEVGETMIADKRLPLIQQPVLPVWDVMSIK